MFAGVKTETRIFNSVTSMLQNFLGHQLLPMSLLIISLSKVFRSIGNSLLQKWDQSDVDPQEFKGVIRTS